MSSSHQESVVQSQPRTPIVIAVLASPETAHSDLTVDPAAQRTPASASR